MNDKLDDFVNNLQKQIFDEAKDTLGEAGFERWQNPKYRGKIENHDVHVKVTGACGDTMEIFFKIDNGKILDASYITDGCGASNVCGSFAAELAINKKIEDIADITEKDILAKLGNLPDKEQHCATLAAGTLHEALKKYMRN
ncbi:MAG: iron-sulfur cluster assembly scaffold protein [Desulfobacteraceae bacterium 4572_130]|nr:MAG: iron-sulfur cluster assembly scaffold protein [Desulfobacteraceae bacterium 4572_130]